jgi:hypothetical protein
VTGQALNRYNAWAAIRKPRPLAVINFEAGGSALYTVQALAINTIWFGKKFVQHKHCKICGGLYQLVLCTTRVRLGALVYLDARSSL